MGRFTEGGGRFTDPGGPDFRDLFRTIAVKWRRFWRWMQLPLDWVAILIAACVVLAFLWLMGWFVWMTCGSLWDVMKWCLRSTAKQWRDVWELCSVICLVFAPFVGIVALVVWAIRRCEHRVRWPPHRCRQSKTCCCGTQAVEPNENCPVHGHPYPIQCEVCGRFIKGD